MNPFTRVKAFRCMALLFLVAITGCLAVVTNSNAPDDGIRNTFPLKFTEHNFGAYCFNAIGCKVLYAGFYEVHDEEGEVSPPPTQGYLDRLSGGYGGIVNFPPPAVVTWRSLDGVSHKEEIDIGAIFKDELVMHHVPREEIPTDSTAVAAPGPDVILVINDRTIDVYMRAMVFLKKPRVPSNPLSDMVNESVLAFTRTY